MSALKTGADTNKADQTVIQKALQAWAQRRGAANFGHWFFPLRTGGGIMGSTAGVKHDTFIDLDWASPQSNKPYKATMRKGGLFLGETDGSSFPNGGLRQTHTAAAFTAWDRASPPFVVDDTLYVPCALISQLGAALDDKAPVLRASSYIDQQGKRLLKNMNMSKGVSEVVNYLGWEQEFFVISRENYLARPDLVACGRTIIGAEMNRGQQGDQNYFAVPPENVKLLMHNIQSRCLAIGMAMNVSHNEVAPAQHEMSPIFTTTNISVDQNQMFMQLAQTEATKMGLMVLYHEKPFAGINGSGKHCNWSCGTNQGKNFFDPGSANDKEQQTLFTASLACLAHAVMKHQDVLRCCVATPGNDWRLGAQEAPPAIISLYPGPKFEAHVDAIIAGGPLTGYTAESVPMDTRCPSLPKVKAHVEDRNRTAPFPFCGNRFEFRAAGSSQNCGFPMACINSAFADGMCTLSDLLENGMGLNDAVKKMFADNRQIIFTGNGYGEEWPLEAEKVRGLSNLRTTPMAAATFNSDSAKEMFAKAGVWTPEEVDARAELLYENFSVCLGIEANTLVEMVRTGVLPACAEDLSIYKDSPQLAGSRKDLYSSIKEEVDKIEPMLEKLHGMCVSAEAKAYDEDIKPQMLVVRALVDKAERLVKKGLWPFPSYESITLGHHFD